MTVSADAQVSRLEVLLPEFGSFSLPETVVVFVAQVKPGDEAVPVSVTTKESPLTSTPSEQERSFPVTTQPAVVVATLVTSAGTESATRKPELFPGP